jgi:hypothetical protein
MRWTGVYLGVGGSLAAPIDAKSSTVNVRSEQTNRQYRKRPDVARTAVIAGYFTNCLRFPPHCTGSAMAKIRAFRAAQIRIAPGRAQSTGFAFIVIGLRGQ